MCQENQDKKTAGIDGIKSLPPKQRLKLVNLYKT
ncbi:MAG: reverse transcriptase N-terminal domain-containing protein [Trichodesmium sp. ALOHA_ZT_67]|nr:reverse transcriptase N-terminal domain-containing protein [Trichodesmium sp. ALOHA_ZT_67]MDE5096511.1 reverse transcriptase N-terminal domain-containing protein [Trichodesmium sp. St11_bin5]MDT9338268.1 reverse transcriptase N-terminal domain-containing protein [Trichodesmium erythraeum 21-75]